MKRKLLSITAVLLICLTSMFMFAGCGLTDADREARYGVLTVGGVSADKSISISLNKTQREEISKGRLHYHSILQNAGLSFTYTAPTSEVYKYEKVYNPEKNKYDKVEIKSITESQTVTQMVEKGMSITGWNSAVTKEGESRKLTFSYRGARTVVYYTITHTA